jgi:predicted nucleic acid-binding Zn ribbon protein
VEFLEKEKSGLKKHSKPPKHDVKAGKLLQHRHCQVCSKAIPLSEEVCSEECRAEFDALVKKRRNFLYIFYAMIAVFIIFLLLGFI